MKKNNKGKLTLIILCFALLGVLSGVIINEFVGQEVAIIEHNNVVEENAYQDLK